MCGETEATDQRTRRIALGSAALLGSALVTFAAGFVLAGVMARAFSPEEFGLWGILVSLSGIFLNGFDWGFGNALRNRLAQLSARGGHQDARVYFSTVFSWFLANAAVLAAVIWLARPWLPWGAILGTGEAGLVRAGSALLAFACSTLALNTAFNLSTAGFFGYGESHWNACFNALGKLSVLFVTVVLVFEGRSFFLVNVAAFLALLGSSVISFAAFLVIRRWSLVVAGFRRTLAIIGELWGKSALFCLLQVFSLLLLNGDVLVASAASGLGQAGDYFIVKRLFLAVSTLHFALLLPLWTEYTRAAERRDHAWARGMLNRTAYLTCLLFCAGSVILVLAGDAAAFLWTGRRIGDPMLFFWLGIWALLYGWNNCFSVFLNAVGRLRRQAILVMAGTAVFFPLGSALGRRWGVTGVCWALILVSIPAAFSNPLESFQALREHNLCRKEARDG